MKKMVARIMKLQLFLPQIDALARLGGALRENSLTRPQTTPPGLAMTGLDGVQFFSPEFE
jgi:hypothetical protein